MRLPVILFFALVLPGFLFFHSCIKPDTTGNSITHDKNSPEMSAQNIDVLFSDSGKIQARIISPLLNRFGGNDPYLEFPNGFKIWMYDSVQAIRTTITGNRGIRKEVARTMEAWGNVVVRNEKKNEQLNTEHLLWDENKHSISSDVKVKITTPDKILFGDSMESNESFTNYSISNVTGQMTVKKDSL